LIIQIANLTGLWLSGLLFEPGRESFFHTDAHTGNIMVLPAHDMLEVWHNNNKQELEDAKLALIDFGSFGTLKTKEKEALRQALLASNEIEQFSDKYLYILDNKILPAEYPSEIDKINEQILKREEKIHDHDIHLVIPEKEVPVMFKGLGSYSLPLRVAIKRDYILAAIKEENYTEEKIKTLRKDNIKKVFEFIGHLDKLCGVEQICQKCNRPKKQSQASTKMTAEEQEMLQEQREKLAEGLIDYMRYIELGSLFLNYVLLAPDIGNCSASNVLMFGRGIAYIMKSLQRVEALQPPGYQPLDILRILKSEDVGDRLSKISLFKFNNWKLK
jgi:hypothetical protein